MTIVITSNRNIKHKKNNNCEMTDFTSHKTWPRHRGLAEYSKMIQEIEGTLNTEDWLSQCLWCLNPSFGPESCWKYKHPGFF